VTPARKASDAKAAGKKAGGAKAAKKASRGTKKSAPDAEPAPEIGRPVEATAEAQPVPADETGGDGPAVLEPGRIVVFRVEGQRYALPIDAVQEIQQIVAMSEVPDASAAVLGVINLRGTIVPALDLRALVGLEPKAYGLQTPMVFTRTAQGLVALVVDEVEDVVEVPTGMIQPASGVYALAERLSGVCRLEGGLVFVFDVDALVPPALVDVGRS
jgi:purine-binding chemotaxis protein CheW